MYFILKLRNRTLSYNLFLLFKIDSLEPSEYRQQIKTFRLKYVFLAAKIIKTARTVIMNLSENYPYKEVYEKCLVLLQSFKSTIK
ncbi:transposase [Lactococcus lactis]|uniref:transposase n=2 Tax=Lactococcus lactis TaxID=1358 RepID=UPI003D13F9FA